MIQQPYFANYTNNNRTTFVGWIQDDKIYFTDVDGQHIIGVTNKSFEQLKADYDSVFERCQQYYDKLVELGEIKPELTGDALIKAQAEKLEQASQLITQMSKNQDHLLSVVKDLQDRLMSKENINESATANTESNSGNISAMEGTNNTINTCSGKLQEHKRRLIAGNK